MTKVIGKPFEKGKSGNPGGRPKQLDEVKEMAREHTEAAIKRLAFWMKSSNSKASIAASNALLDRAWGKPAQPLSGDDDNPFEIIHRIERVIVDSANKDS